MSESLLKRAANVLQKRIELNELIEQVKDAGGDWTTLTVAADDAMEIAETGLRQCWRTLDNIRRIARTLPTPPKEDAADGRR